MMNIKIALALPTTVEQLEDYCRSIRECATAINPDANADGELDRAQVGRSEDGGALVFDVRNGYGE